MPRLLINNAGVRGPKGPLVKASAADWRATLDACALPSGAVLRLDPARKISC